MRPLKRFLLDLLRALDLLLGRIRLALLPPDRERYALAFHHCFADQAAADSYPGLPMEGLTADHFRQLVRQFKALGFTFVRPPDLLTPLQKGQRQLLLTFDDGYANFRHLLPILEQEQVPVTLFPVTHNLIAGEAFWWDQVHRHGQQHHRTHHQIATTIRDLSRLPFAELRAQIPQTQPNQGNDPAAPLTPEDLRHLAASPFVDIGNHTHHHQICKNTSPELLQTEIQQAQDLLREWTGQAPTAFAYPDGVWDHSAHEVVRQAGFQTAFTAGSGHLQPGQDPHLLPRTTFHSQAPIAHQIVALRSGISLVKALSRRKRAAYAP